MSILVLSLVVLVVCALSLYLVNILQMPAPLDTVARVLVIVIAVFYIARSAGWA